MRTRGAIVALATSLLAAHAAPSFAQPRPSTPPAAGQADPSALARSRFTEGVAFAKRKDWPRAYAAFREAWGLKNHPQIALNLGRAEIETGKHRDAISHLQYCVDNMEPADPDLKLARDWLAEARSKAAKLLVTVDVAGADVRVDGALEGKAPLSGPVLVDPGKHLVEVIRGERRAQQSVEVESGATSTIDLRLPPEEPTRAEPVLPPGQERPFPLRKVVLVGGAAATLVGVGIGATLGGLALQKQSERDACTGQLDRACWTALEADRVSMARGSLGAFIAGGLFAAGTAAFFFFGPRDTGVAVTPAASSEGAALFAAGRF